MNNNEIKSFDKLSIFRKVYIFLTKYYVKWLIFFEFLCIIELIIFEKITEKYLKYNSLDIMNKIKIIDAIISIIICIIGITLIIKCIKFLFNTLKLNKIIKNGLINKTKEEVKCVNYFKKYFKYIEFRILILYYDLTVANLNLKPSEFISFFKEKINKNEFYIYKSKEEINYTLRFYDVYLLFNWINEIILGNKINIEEAFSYKYHQILKYIEVIENLEKNENFINRILSKIYLNRLKRIKRIYLTMLIKYYSDKDYNALYDTLVKYYKVYEYDLTKSLLVFLYISAEKTKNSIDFLPEITKQKMYEVIKEDEFKQFVEKELN